MKCCHCGAIQYQSKASRNQSSLVILLPLIIIPVAVIFNLSSSSIFWLDFAILLVILFVAPFLLKLTDEDDPLW